MNYHTSDNKRYEKYTSSQYPELFKGYADNYTIDVPILVRLAKDLGFSYDLYTTIAKIDESAASTMIESMSLHSKRNEIVLLLDEENKEVIDYSLETDRYPLLNSEFIKRVCSLAETSDDIELSEIYYHKDDTKSSVIFKKKSPITVEEKYINKESKFIDYSVGVLIVNDEISSAYSRLVLYVEGQPLYLPASYYNTATSRYKRSTDSSASALEVLVLKIIDDLREDSLSQKVYDIHYKYRSNKYTFASYEEYNTILRTMRKIPSIIDDNSFLESLLGYSEDFEKKYINLDDQKSSYIWRCTALSEIPLGSLISITSQILTELSAPTIEYMSIRELLGEYLSTDRIASEIAKESMS